jgi:transposase
LKGLIDLVDCDSLALQQDERYASDLSDEEFALVRPLLPAAKPCGRKPTDPRAILNALFYLVRAGCTWRYLPNDFPPFTPVQNRF